MKWLKVHFASETIDVESGLNMLGYRIQSEKCVHLHSWWEYRLGVYLPRVTCNFWNKLFKCINVCAFTALREWNWRENSSLFVFVRYASKRYHRRITLFTMLFFLTKKNNREINKKNEHFFLDLLNFFLVNKIPTQDSFRNRNVKFIFASCEREYR